MAEQEPPAGTTTVHVDPAPHTPGGRAARREPKRSDPRWIDWAQRRYDELSAELEELRAAGISGRRAPRRPSFGMSEGERAELEQRGVTTDPFVGGTRNVLDEDGVEPGNDDARRRAELDKAQRAAPTDKV